MNRQLMRLLIITVVLAVLFVAGCGTPAAEPVAEAPLPTATPPPADLQQIDTAQPTPVFMSSALTPTTSLDSALISKIETAIQETMKRKQLPGLAIGIIKDGQVVYTNGFGLAEVDTDRQVTPETVFKLGSVSKLMVGIALMQLKEQGKIDLDAPVTTYLPYFQLASESGNDITIRQLLSHRSGLTLTTSHLEDFMSPEYDEGSLERHVRDLAHLKLGYLPPSTRMQYSDIGFEVLGDVIAKVSGQSFEDYTQEHIFTPLGMKHTTFLVQEVPPELLATPHEFGGSKARVLSFFPYSRKHAPSSHLFSNVDDMSRYALAQLAQGRGEGMAILPAAAYEEMWTAQGDTNLPSPWRKDVGLGWFLGNHEGHRLVGHGETEKKGFGCGFIMAPDDGLAVIIMTNRDYLVENFSYQVMGWLLEAETKS